MAYHAGVLSALADAGWDARNAEVVVGTSAGSFTGAELRAGLSPQDLAARRSDSQLSNEARSLLMKHGAPPVVHPHNEDVDVEEARRAYRELARKACLFPGSVSPSVLLSTALSPGRLSTTWIAETVRWLHGGDEWPEAALWICAVRLDTGGRTVFGRDPVRASIGQAVASSCAIPGVNAPVRIGCAAYIDGGACSPTNLDLVAGLGLDVAVVSAPMSAEPDAATDRRDRSVRSGCRTMLEREARRVREAGTHVVAFEPTREDLRAMGRLVGADVLDERRCAEVLDSAYASATANVAAAGDIFGSASGSAMSPHPEPQAKSCAHCA